MSSRPFARRMPRRRSRGRPTRRPSSQGGSCSSAGQLGLEPGAKEVVEGGIGPQTERVFANLRAILEAAGSGIDRIVKTTVFLTNLDDFAGMNEVYAKQVGDTPPARSTIEIGRLPAGALVEIEAIALA